jgi:hypothetical protein
LEVNGTKTGKALAIFNETGTTNDVLTASVSGATKFRITNAGNAVLAASSYLNFGATEGTSGYGIRDNGGTMQYKNSAGSWTNIGSGGSGSSNWQVNSGAVSPANLTYDVTLGATATASAKVVLASSLTRGMSVAVFNQTEASAIDVFTASASGATLFKMTQTGPQYVGAGRPTKTITLSPEYSGAVLSAFYGAGTDTNITGTMTSGAETTSGNGYRTYYDWTRTTATEHFYTVAVRATLPSDFDAWTTSNALQVDYRTGSATAGNSLVDIYVYNSGNATQITSSTNNAATSWSTATIDDSALDSGAAQDWDAANETAVIYLRLGSQSSN